MLVLMDNNVAFTSCKGGVGKDSHVFTDPLCPWKTHVSCMFG